MATFLKKLHPLAKYPIIGFVIAEILSVCFILLTYNHVISHGYKLDTIVLQAHVLHWCYFIIPMTAYGFIAWKIRNDRLSRILKYSIIGFCASYLISPLLYIFAIPLTGQEHTVDNFLRLFSLFTLITSAIFAFSGSMKVFKQRMAVLGLSVWFLLSIFFMRFHYLGAICMFSSIAVPVILFGWSPSRKSMRYRNLR